MQNQTSFCCRGVWKTDLSASSASRYPGRLTVEQSNHHRYNNIHIFQKCKGNTSKSITRGPRRYISPSHAMAQNDPSPAVDYFAMIACAALEKAKAWALFLECVVWARRHSPPEVVRCQKPTSACDANRVFCQDSLLWRTIATRLWWRCARSRWGS